MYSLKRNIPNIITLTNLLCGLCAIIFVFHGDIILSGIFIFFGALFDFTDGLAARALNVNSELGKMLDSMADLVTFGVAPGLIIFNLIYTSQPDVFFISNVKDPALVNAFISFLIPIFSAIRLAKYNVDTTNKDQFTGLPTPACAIFVAALPIINEYQEIELFNEYIFLSILSIILPILLVSNISFFNLKFRFSENKFSRINIFRISLIISTFILFFLFKFVAIPFIILLYIILSLLNNIL